MKKTTFSILAAGALAVAGMAQAQTFDSPVHQAGEASTMTMSQPNMVTTNSPWGDNQVIVDTTVLGAGPMVVTTPGYVMVQPMTVTPVYVTPGVVTYSYGTHDVSDFNAAYSSPGSMYYGN